MTAPNIASLNVMKILVLPASQFDSTVLLSEELTKTYIGIQNKTGHLLLRVNLF